MLYSYHQILRLIMYLIVAERRLKCILYFAAL